MGPNLTWKGGIATVVLVALLASVGVGYAAIPSADGVIHACYNDKSNPVGMLRVIDVEAGAKCSKNEKSLTFNQTGPAGPQGPAGSQGEPGTPGISTATFAGTTTPVELNLFSTPTKVLAKNLPAGSWAIVATANTYTIPGGADGGNDNLSCELRNGAVFIGGAADRSFTVAGVPEKRSLSMNGGAQVPAGGGEVSLWCSSQSAEGEWVDYAQMMMIQVGGFS